MENKIAETLKFIREIIEITPEILIILGSSLGKVADNIERKIIIPFMNIPHFRKTTALSHRGNLIFGEIAQKKVMVMQGRYHVYEGYDASFTTYPVRIASHMGIKKLITTNLSGGINDALEIGDFMVIEDHINLSGTNPLIWTEALEKKYVDMYNAYTPELIRLLELSASELKINLKKGILAYLTGPNFETRAELRMLKMLGADAVGWSIVPEVLEARRCSMEVLGIACISDLSNPKTFNPVYLDRLYQTGEDKSYTLFSLLVNLINKLQ